MQDRQITEILNKKAIDQDTWNQILPIVYQQMKAIAKGVKFGHRKLTQLNTTSLVHEAYLKLQNNQKLNLHGTNHFYRLAAIAMRQIMLDTVRSKNSIKRINNEEKQDNQQFNLEINEQHISAQDLIEIDRALNQLEEFSPRLADIVINHFYGGFTFDQIAEMLNISKRTVIRDWKKAKGFIYAQLQQN